MRKVYVLGVGQSMFGKYKELLATELGTTAAKAAIKDAGINPKKIQVAYGSRAIEGNTAIQDIMKNVGVAEIEMNNVENACGSGITATNLLYRDIAYGIYDIGIAVGTDSMSTSNLAGKVLAPQKDIDGYLGISMPSYFALIARRLMYDYGATLEDLAYPTIKNHINGCLNPYSMYKKRLTIEDVLASPIVSDPIKVLECCPSTDGAAAVILCTEEIARQYTAKLIRMETSIIRSGCFDTPQRDIVGDRVVADMANASYEMAGIGPEDIDVIELHDAFSPEEIWAYETLGLCKKGEAISFMKSGAVDLGGKIPVNPSGGLLALGHPIAASGIRVLNEITLQLRGEAGEHQVKNAKTGLAQMVGGYVTGLVAPVAGGIQILTR